MDEVICGTFWADDRAYGVRADVLSVVLHCFKIMAPFFF